MVLEIKRLSAKGEYSGNFSYRVSPEKDMLLLPLCEFEDDVKVDGEYEIFDDDEVEVRFNLSYRIKGSCSYCLKDAARDVNYSAEVLYVTDGEDKDNYLYDGNRLDLSKAVNEAILFSQPNVLLCDECGTDKNTDNN